MELNTKVKTLPTLPGVYLMKDKKNEVIYVGKAKNLRNRVRSYFQVNTDERLYSKFMVKRVNDIDFLVTDTEKEALILENNLIKQFKPRFNINLRDDKTFVSVKIDLRKPFPYPGIVRQIENDGSLYFGPYSSSKSIRGTLRYINEVFFIRKCTDNVFKSRKRPCLYYQLGKCLGPCCNLVDKKTYRDLIDQVVLVLKGKTGELVKVLKGEMEKASMSLKYEDAAKIRDRLNSIEQTVEKQKIHSMKFVDRDVFGYCVEGKDMCIQAMFIRSGNLTNASSYNFTIKYYSAESIFGSFLNQFYLNNCFIPTEVIIPVTTEDMSVLSEVLSELKGQKVEIINPQRGDKVKLLEMALKNAASSLKLKHEHGEGCADILSCMATTFDLKNYPATIECFDVSNLTGELAVGAMVVFKDGIQFKSGYRKFKIKDMALNDDFSMMREILKRRYIRALDENCLPDLAVIDGGKGHLSVAVDVLKELGISSMDVISIAKGKKRKNTIDHIFNAANDIEYNLAADSPELLLVQRIRDEAHRFAITYHRKIRQKEQMLSSLNTQ